MTGASLCSTKDALGARHAAQTSGAGLRWNPGIPLLDDHSVFAKRAECHIS